VLGLDDSFGDSIIQDCQVHDVVLSDICHLSRSKSNVA
jgi:hypothetical protein